MSTIRVIKINSQNDMETAFAIRRQVFVLEQHVDPQDEYDEFEESSFHFLALNEFGKAVGTARWRKTTAGVKLERFAVLSEARNCGVGQALVKNVLEDINRSAFQTELRYLNAQLPAIALYEKFGFNTIGQEFLECNIRHRRMELKP